ncbi:endonuclease domain-containing protein [Streptomyces sasae]|uniref:endonuclease domain-containing protein n=1 Tax=Streptomyces sasae TaxID=1266772 RepID=UPI0029304173|nr:endonuclease domain-containing protein [Streptomyces sasae]
MDVVTLNDLPESRRETLLWKRAWWMTYEDVDEWVRERSQHPCLSRQLGTWDAQAVRAVLGDDGRYHLVDAKGVLCSGTVHPRPLTNGQACGTRLRHAKSVTWLSDGTPLRAGVTIPLQLHRSGEVWFEHAEVAWQVVLTDAERAPSLTQYAERCPGYLREWPAPVGTTAVARVRARLIEEMGEACQACGSLPGVYVDHDHVTGQVRGLLCADCNTRVDGCPHPDGCVYASYLAAPPAAPLGLTYPNHRKVWATEKAKIEFVGLDPYAHLR